MSSKSLGNEPLVNNFKVPNWAGRPPAGLHLDVIKDGKLIQKLMIDEKKCYFFGRNRQLCDFPVDHQSCSRVHSALVWHKHLNRPFLIDLGSVHGTYIGRISLESNKPQQVPIDSEIHFGASTRIYVIRERPQQTAMFSGLAVPGGALKSQGAKADGHDGTSGGDLVVDSEGNFLGLPETERELDNLTEFNTAHNRRIATMVDVKDTPNVNKKRRRANIRFAEQDEVINPEDVDPTVGRFRNLVQETFIPNKKPKLSKDAVGLGADLGRGSAQRAPSNPMAAAAGLGLGHSAMGAGLSDHGASSALTMGAFSVAAKLGLPVPNLAPDVDAELTPLPSALISARPVVPNPAQEETEPKKKKYAKEAWPGKRPSFLVGAN